MVTLSDLGHGGRRHEPLRVAVWPRPASPVIWNFVGGPPEQYTPAKDGLNQHCADAGVQLAIVTPRPPHTAAVLQPIANALAELA